MTKTRSGFYSPSPRDSGWMTRRKRRTWAGWPGIPHLLFVFASFAARSAAWEDKGDDAVNVISVENMDALLGLRMVTELKSFEGFKTNESENGFEEGGNGNDTDRAEEEGRTGDSRYKRTVDYKWKSVPASSSVSDLCSLTLCLCTTNLKSERNVSCHFQNEEIVLEPGSVPSNTQEIYISDAESVTVSPGTFSNHQPLQKAVFQNVNALLIFGASFHNLSARNQFNLTVKNCKRLIVEDHSFRNLHNPMTVLVTHCDHVILKKSTFYWFRGVQMSDIGKLQLEENTFSSEVKQDVEWFVATISFSNVAMDEIPNATFPLSSAKILFSNCTVTAIRSGAFNGIALVSVSFRDSRVRQIQREAFSERTLLQNLEFDNVDIQSVDSNALSAAARLTIRNCRVMEMTSGAFNVSTAYLKLISNYFLKIRRHAFEIHNWNSILIEGNHFNDLEPEFFSVPYSNVTAVTMEFSFANNTLARAEIGVLSFVPDDRGLSTYLEGNVFENVCHCHLKTWMRERTGNSWEIFYETSYCAIGELLEKCYNLTRGYMNTRKYEEEYCGEENAAFACEEVRKTYRPNILIPIDLHNTERTVLGVIFLGVMCSIAIMLAFLMLMWAKNRRFCGRKVKSQTPDADCFPYCCSRLCGEGNLVRSHSISRMNIHEYAEIQNQLNHRQKQTNLIREEEAEDEEETIECENKATQTIPEELTQELIQSLREKLDDPENYNEARDMIEHLYDLIKVEESCNNNHSSRPHSFVLDEEFEEMGGSIYEVIRSNKSSSSAKNSKSRRKNTGNGGVEVATTGTRAPSPDKLSPVTFNVIRSQQPPPPLPPPLTTTTTTVVSDYLEPKDRKSNEYCELPAGNFVMPDVLTSSKVKSESTLAKSHIYAEPLQSGTATMVGRPLPNKPADPGTSKP